MVELLQKVAETIKEKITGIQVVWTHIPTTVSDIQGLVWVKLNKISSDKETSSRIVWRYRYDLRVEIWTRLENVARWYEIADKVIETINNKDIGLDNFTTMQMNEAVFLEQRGEYMYGYIDFETYKVGV